MKSTSMSEPLLHLLGRLLHAVGQEILGKYSRAGHVVNDTHISLIAPAQRRTNHHRLLLCPRGCCEINHLLRRPLLVRRIIDSFELTAVPAVAYPAAAKASLLTWLTSIGLSDNLLQEKRWWLPALLLKAVSLGVISPAFCAPPFALAFKI